MLVMHRGAIGIAVHLSKGIEERVNIPPLTDAKILSRISI
jgi:hypothetical protein